jgi:hypothetical protein
MWVANMLFFTSYRCLYRSSIPMQWLQRTGRDRSLCVVVVSLCSGSCSASLGSRTESLGKKNNSPGIDIPGFHSTWTTAYNTHLAADAVPIPRSRRQGWAGLPTERSSWCWERMLTNECACLSSGRIYYSASQWASTELQVCFQALYKAS